MHGSSKLVIHRTGSSDGDACAYFCGVRRAARGLGQQPDLGAAVKRVVRLLLEHARGGLAADVYLMALALQRPVVRKGKDNHPASRYGH